MTEESYISPCFSGGERSANKLFQIAATYAHALRQGLDYRIPWQQDSISRDLFQLLKPSIPTQCIEGGYHQDITYTEPNFSYKKIPEHIRQGALHGYFQSELYFDDAREELRSFFTPLILPRKKNIAGIHLRLGDYLNYDHTFRLPEPEFLSRALALISPSIHELIIFSDSPEKAWTILKKIPEARRFSVKLDDHNTLDALKELTSMKELILACSTFSWWGAWLGRPEKAIVHKEWFSSRITDYQDIYCDSWIKI